MSSTGGKGSTDSYRRQPPADDAIVFPDAAEPTDETPTIISKSQPVVEPAAKASSATQHITDLAKRSAYPTPDVLVSSLRGQKLAHFELIEPLGVGGMAAVLRARDTQLDRFVALKILPPEMAADPENVRRFHQEAKAAAKLDHANIARVFFCGEDQGLHFISFEYVEGDNLRTILERRGRLPVAEAVRCVLQVATGLEHASARGVVHRDVKPSNIIVMPSGQAKLVDMGLARNMERHGSNDLTQSGVTLGTFDYISPEQALEPREADARSDIYSLGCTFYHMLTGQTPAPDGTAAKKLHHHQHVLPTDPRTLNPRIPDEVAAVVGRMMAKDPRERYQRPIHLVQHLMQVAQKVGVADDLPEGVLFVDAPLPAPRSRPIVVVGLAALSLIILLGLWSLVPPDAPKAPQPKGPGSSSTEAKKDAGPTQDKPPEPTPVKTGSVVVSTPEGLAAALKEKGPIILVKLEGRIDLTDQDFTFPDDGKHVTLESNLKTQAVLVFRADAGKRPAGLLVSGGNLTLKNVKVELQANSNPLTATAPVLVKGGALTAEHCDFIQKDVPQFDPESRRPRLASVLIEPSEGGGGGPAVTLRECYFHGVQALLGQAAVAVNGAASVDLTDCSFRPHDALIDLRGECRADFTRVGVARCSALMAEGAAFRFDEKAGGDLHASKSIFSCPESAAFHLIRQADNTPLRFHGEQNCYHNVNAFWVRGRDIERATLKLFRESLAEQRDSDLNSDEFARADSPWAAGNPLANPSAAEKVAFQLKQRFSGLGVQRSAWGTPLAPEPEPEPVIALDKNQKLVDPDYAGKQLNVNIFNSVHKAIALAEPNDVILLKPGKKGPQIEVKPLVLKDKKLDVTLRPYKDTQPILVQGEPGEKKDNFLFRLVEGSLHLENLHIVFEPKLKGDVQSFLLLGDNARCTFDNCVLTLKAAQKSLSESAQKGLSAVSFIDPKDQMKPDLKAPGNAHVTFRNSFVRGDGDLLSLLACRQLRLSLDNTLVAVGGSLLYVQAAADDMPMDQGPTVELLKSSVFTREPLLVLRCAGNGKGLTKTEVKVSDSLLATLTDRPLIHLVTPDVLNEDEVTKYLGWQGEHNLYTGRLLEQGRPDMGPSMQLSPDNWKSKFSTAKSLFKSLDDLDLPSLRPADAVLWQLTPADLRPAAESFAGFARPELDAVLKAPKTAAP